ncbi:ankyrin repeat domain-containing protein [Fusobacterium animalis]|uniref:ankyrin repeat domain-containing protein n=1 Tax=Fusobacterium animalis TaxID=76859 RepID=UPI003862E4A4
MAKRVIQAFLKKGGIDFDKRDKYGNTFFMYVCLKSYKDITKLILESGADISIKDNQEHKAIDYATANDLRDIISILTSDIT